VTPGTPGPAKDPAWRVPAWLLGFLKQGLDPDHLALGVALGVVAGVFPIFGATTLLAAAAAVAWRLNMPLVQAVNYLVTPLHLAMILPWVWAGDRLFQKTSGALTLEGVTAMVEQDPWGAVEVLGWAALRAAGAWALAAPLLAFSLYHGLRPVFRRLGSAGR
jgi:hypothetical protein